MDKIPLLIKCKTLDSNVSVKQSDKYLEYAREIIPKFMLCQPVEGLISIYSLPLISDSVIKENRFGYIWAEESHWPRPILINQKPIEDKFFPVTILDGPCEPEIRHSVYSILWDFVFSAKFKIKPIEVSIPDCYVFDSIRMVYLKGHGTPGPGSFKLLFDRIDCPEGWFTCYYCDKLFQEKDRDSLNDVICPHCGRGMNPLFSERYHLKTLDQYLHFNPSR